MPPAVRYGPNTPGARMLPAEAQLVCKVTGDHWWLSRELQDKHLPLPNQRGPPEPERARKLVPGPWAL
eukprot:gene41847-34169_t